MIDRELMRAFHRGIEDGLEKEAGGLQSLGRAVLKMRALKASGTLGSRASRLAAMETQLAGRLGEGGMAAFNKHGLGALKGTGKAGGKGKRVIKGTSTRAAGTVKDVRKAQSAEYASAQKLRPTATTKDAITKQRTAFRNTEGMATGKGMKGARADKQAYRQQMATQARPQLPGAPIPITNTMNAAGAPVRQYSRGPVQQGMFAGFMNRARPYAVPT